MPEKQCSSVMTVNPAVSFSFSALNAAYHESSRTCRTVTLRHACIAAEGGGLFSLQAMGRRWEIFSAAGKVIPLYQRGAACLREGRHRLPGEAAALPLSSAPFFPLWGCVSSGSRGSGPQVSNPVYCKALVCFHQVSSAFLIGAAASFFTSIRAAATSARCNPSSGAP